ncbi:hypothetical protein ACWCQW_48055 [Streptomyces mirabilis]
MTEQIPSGRPRVHFPPIANGIDYLQSVVNHLAGEPTVWDLKYAVLHLQSATEVLLKARLQQEHWSLVLKDPGRADHARFRNAEFESCGTTEAISRLRGIAGIAFPETDTKEIAQLAKWRNALQHYGLSVAALAVESRAAQVLDILLRFVTEHLVPGLSGEEADFADEGIYAVRSRLTEIQAFIKTRMDRLRPELERYADRTITCPECSQPALPLAIDGPLSCRFCEETWASPEQLAGHYARIVLDPDACADYENGGDGPLARVCPDCGSELLVLEARTAAAPDRPSPLCFSCGNSYEALVACEYDCGSVVVPTKDGRRDLCPMCFEHAYGFDKP